MTKREPHGYESFPSYKQGYDDYVNGRAFYTFANQVDQQAYDHGLNDAMLDEREKEQLMHELGEWF